MVVNCQSLRRRKDIFQTSIAQIRPDVIIGTESWLDPVVHRVVYVFAVYVKPSIAVIAHDSLVHSFNGFLTNMILKFD
jgi:hypothetical protein